MLIAGVDEKGPQLYHTDPSGTFTRYEAKAIGSGSEAAQTELKEQYHKVNDSFLCGTYLRLVWFYRLNLPLLSFYPIVADVG